MKAIINITTAAGKSFDGFPKETIIKHNSEAMDLELTSGTFMLSLNEYTNAFENKLHPGDKITIEIKET